MTPDPDALNDTAGTLQKEILMEGPVLCSRHVQPATQPSEGHSIDGDLVRRPQERQGRSRSSDQHGE